MAALAAAVERFGPADLAVLVFPSNQFHQEPLEGQAPAFRKFCEDGLGGELPPGVRLMEPVRVNGPDTHPVYQLLKQSEANNMRESDQTQGYFQRGFEEDADQGRARMVPWNWSFFVVGRDGRVLDRLDAGASTNSLLAAAEHAVNGPTRSR